MYRSKINANPDVVVQGLQYNILANQHDLQKIQIDNDTLNNSGEIIAALITAISEKQEKDHSEMPETIKVPEKRRTGEDVKRELEEANPGYIFDKKTGKMEKKPLERTSLNIEESIALDQIESKNKPEQRKRERGKRIKPFMPPRPEPPKKKEVEKPKRGRPKGSKNKTK